MFNILIHTTSSTVRMGCKALLFVVNYFNYEFGVEGVQINGGVPKNHHQLCRLGLLIASPHLTHQPAGETFRLPFPWRPFTSSLPKASSFLSPHLRWGPIRHCFSMPMPAADRLGVVEALQRLGLYGAR